MIFTPTPLQGAFVIHLQAHFDERGFFSRSYCQREFESQGLTPTIAQCNIAYNRNRGTLRGMHWRDAESPEAKLVRVTRGAILDVIIDLRPESSTYLQHFAIELTESNHLALYIPCLFAHGFQTLVDHSEVFYQMSAFYDPIYDRGARWDDPAFKIQWPITDPIMNDRDRNYSDFAP